MTTVEFTGTIVEVYTADAIPPQTGHAGEVLTTNGSTLAWAAGGAGGAGAVGGGTDEVFYENDTQVTFDYTITAGKNAVSAGPITIDTGAIVTIPAGSVWTIV